MLHCNSQVHMFFFVKLIEGIDTNRTAFQCRQMLFYTIGILELALNLCMQYIVFSFGYCTLNTRIEQKTIVIVGSNNPCTKSISCSSPEKNVVQGIVLPSQVNLGVFHLYWLFIESYTAEQIYQVLFQYFSHSYQTSG